MKRVGILILLCSCFGWGQGQTTANITPASTGQKLGSVNQRWDAFIQNLDVSGTITAPNVNGVITVQGPPGLGVDTSSNVVFTGDNRDRAANGVYYTSPELDGTGGVSGLNLNICQAIDRGWTWAVAKGWHGVTIDARAWHGVQTACAGSQIFQDYPFTAGGPASFSGTIITSSDVDIPLTDTLVMPDGSRWDGSTAHAECAPPFNPGNGTCIHPANGFPINTPVIEYGVTNAGGGSAPAGITLMNLGVSCLPPSGTYIAGSIGIRDQYAQDNSGAHDLHIQGCFRDIDFENGGTNGGAQNTGYWKNIHMSMENVPAGADGQCMKIGGATPFTGPLKDFGPFSCVNGSGNVQAVGITIDGTGVNLHEGQVESFTSGIIVGGNSVVPNVSLEEIYIVGSVRPVTNGITLTTPNVTGAFLKNIHAVGASGVTNVLVDQMPHGGTVVTSVENTLSLYARGGGSGTHSDTYVLSTSQQIPSYVQNVAPSQLANNAALQATTTGGAACNLIKADAGNATDVQACTSAGTKTLSSSGVQIGLWADNGNFTWGGNTSFANFARFQAQGGAFTGARVFNFPDASIQLNVTGSALPVTQTVDLPSVATGACSAEQTATVTGAASADQVSVTAGISWEAGTFFIGRVTATDTVKWQWCNISGAAIDPANRVYTIMVRKN